MTLYTQWLTVTVMLSSGLLLGILLDVYRICKETFKVRGWIVACIDLLYWFFSAYLVFGLLWWANWGELRFYIFVVICLGFFIYFQWLSKRVSFVLNQLLQYIVVVFGWLMGIIWLVCFRPIIKMFAVIRAVTLLIVIRFPRFIGMKWFQKVPKKQRKSKKNSLDN